MLSNLQAATTKANQVFDPSDNADAITADELQSAADELQKTVESVVSDGLQESHPFVKKATKLSTNLGNIRTKVGAVQNLSRCI